MNNNELSFGQRIDPSNGLIEPWLTNPAMDVIKQWDLKNKEVWEWGGGMSTIWWASKCKRVITIEANNQWFQTIEGQVKHWGLKNVVLVPRNVNEGDQSRIDEYTWIPDMYRPDIVVVDGILRYECILKALTLPRPLTLIVDNWQQDYVFICPAAEEALKKYKGEFYIQPDHTNHEGHPWCTAIWHLEPEFSMTITQTEDLTGLLK